MIRRTVTLHFLFVTLLGGMLLQETHSEPLKRPNVLFLAVDDMRDWVGCLDGYGGVVQTPNIDQLAARGVLFSNAHCPSPKCAPSRAAVMTGLMPSTTGLYGNGHWWYPNLPDTVTMPGHFQQGEYLVVGAGKIFHHTAGNHPPNQWDDFAPIRFRDDPWFRGSQLNYPWSQSDPFPDAYPYGGVGGLPHENDWGVLPIDDADYDDALTVEYAVRFLKTIESKKPFFLACGLFRPHLPWYVPQRFFDLYPLEEVTLPDVLDDDLSDIPQGGRDFANDRRKDFLTIKKAKSWRRAVQAYLASISYADFQVGRVLHALKKSGEEKRTIIVLWSDHGWHLGEKGHWHKSTLWEEATRVPLIIAAPGYQRGVTSAPVGLIDLFPTLNELCGLPEIDSHDGVSLVPFLKNPGLRMNRVVVTEFRKGNAAVRSERYRYIRYAAGGEELYDHSGDPNEWENLISVPEHRALADRLARHLPKTWAPSAPTKAAFDFDPSSFAWTEKRSGRVVSGRAKD